MSCLGVLAVVPGRSPRGAADPYRRIKPWPSARSRDRAAAVGRRLSAAVRPCWSRPRPGYRARPGSRTGPTGATD